MQTRLVMCAAFGKHETPWLRYTGREALAQVRGLGADEMLVVVFDLDHGEDCEVMRLFQGENKLLQARPPVHRYKVQKLVGGSESTTVEVIYNG